MNNTTIKITPLNLQAGVFEADLKQGPKIVLLALVSRLNFKRDDWRVWPSVETLASDCGMHRDTALRSLRTLEQAKLITTTKVKAPTRRGYRNEYEVAVDALAKLAEDRKTRRSYTAKSDSAKSQNPTQLSRKNRHEVENKGSSKEEVANSPATSREKESTDQEAGKQGAERIYSAYERAAEKYSTEKTVLTPKGKKQLKDVAGFVEDCDLDPVVVIENTVPKWDEFKSFARVSRGWSKSFEGGGLSPNPSPQSLVAFREEAVEFYRKPIIEAQKRAEHDKEVEAARAQRELEQARRKEKQEREQAVREAYLRQNPDYCRLTDALAEHRAKKDQSDFGMTEDDCLVTTFVDLGMEDEPFTVSPERAWQDIERDLADELQALTVKLKPDVEKDLFVEAAREDLQALANAEAA